MGQGSVGSGTGDCHIAPECPTPEVKGPPQCSASSLIETD